MITCLGLVVGIVDSVDTQEVLNQCARFLKKYPHLFKCGTKFEIDNEVFFTVIDTHSEDDDILILCEMHNNSIKIGTSK